MLNQLTASFKPELKKEMTQDLVQCGSPLRLADIKCGAILFAEEMKSPQKRWLQIGIKSVDVDFSNRQVYGYDRLFSQSFAIR